MPSPPVSPLPLYRPRDPQASGLWQILDQHFETFRQVYDERFQAKYGFWRPIIDRSVTAFLICGDLHQGFARVRCSDCHHEIFVAFSCKQRCTCPSCHQKRALLTSIHVAEDVCFPVAHRQVVFTIPKRLRLHARFDRGLLGKLSSAAWTCVRDEVRRLLGRKDVLPGMVAAIQTFGEILNFHPHIHTLVTCGAFTATGEFLELRELDIDRLHDAWREAVFALYLAEGKIDAEVVENMRSWPHSGFHVDQSVFLAAGDRAGLERVMHYMTRCPFSLSRLIKVTETGDVVYKAEKHACRVFPDPHGDALEAGPNRNFQILEPLDFLAEFTQHIPPKGAHLVRYYGWYSNKARGLRSKRAAAASNLPSPDPEYRVPRIGAGGESLPRRLNRTWAMLLKRIYEVDPLACTKCGGQMKVVAFIEPPQADVIERILRHCGLWRDASPRPPPEGNVAVYVPDDDGQDPMQFLDGAGEWTFLPDPKGDLDVPWEVTCDASGEMFDAGF